MREDTQEQRMDDEPQHRPEEQETRAARAPVVRLLANPRRVRRA